MLDFYFTENIEQKRTHIPAKVDFIHQKYLNIPYAQGGERNMLDIYLPNDGAPPFLTIIDIFGGGWFFGDKSSHKLEPALALLRRGFAVVSINYSLSWQKRFPAQIYEVKSAIRFIRANAEKYGLDPNHIALMGESAGAHLAALTALSASCGKLEDPDEADHKISDQVQAVIAVYCPSSLGLIAEQFKVLGVEPQQEEFGEADSMEGVLFGYRRAKDAPELVQMANPCNYVSPNSPPFLFLHGDKDRCIPILQSMNLASEILHATDDHHVQYHIVEGAGHNIHDFEREDLYDLESAFLKKWLL